MSLKFHSSLLKDMSSMLNDPNDFDVIIQVGENQNIKEFHAHSIILKTRSTYFKKALSSGWNTKKNDLIKYKKPNIEPAIFEVILSYIYIGEVELTKQSNEFIFGLLTASDELLLEELFRKLQDYLTKERSNWIQDNLVFVFDKIPAIPNYKTLQDYCMKLISNNPKLFFNSKDFPSFNRNTLLELLKQDDFLIDEAIFWDDLIKWSIFNTPSLRSKNRDRTKWNNEDYEALKKTFSQFIPFIRFSEISSADIFDKVRPFKTIIPNNIYEAVMEFHMKGTLPEDITFLPPRGRMIPIDSKIIKPEHAYVIANWIEGDDAKAIHNKNNLRHKFSLLYSCSRDGFNVKSFKNKCMNRGPCLILIKSRSDSLTQPLARVHDSWGSRNSWGSLDGWEDPNYFLPPNNSRVYSPLDTVVQPVQQTSKTPAQNLPKIYGEYYSGTLTHSVWEYTTKDFIFSFANDDDIKDSKISRMKCKKNISKYGINYDHIHLSATFRMNGQNISVNNLLYDDKVINSGINRFTSMDIEVFEVLDD
ncbi:hypothetical protein GLOIN_2v1842942 [Rhizophagus clarus]|uniref:BTB domain-containing protein n=1 Tax=Rhizophagus clarus TaxID=94130 RepID=A0A8H3L4L4_9GLOM|nr:hypothetical protein GLOIN_2v1842942 [Rhizophagus clarus]